MELTRKQVIEELQKMLDYCSIRQDSTPERKQALVYAISSLKTDEAYQIMYEGGEIFTKDNMVDMLEELKTEIGIMSDTVVEDRTVTITSWIGMKKRICMLIQSKIDKLKGDS